MGTSERAAAGNTMRDESCKLPTTNPFSMSVWRMSGVKKTIYCNKQPAFGYRAVDGIEGLSLKIRPDFKLVWELVGVHIYTCESPCIIETNTRTVNSAAPHRPGARSRHNSEHAESASRAAECLHAQVASTTT